MNSGNYDIIMQFDNMLSGGMENVAMDLALFFGGLGYKTGFLVLGETGEAVDRARAAGLPVHVIEGSENALRGFLEEYRPRLVLAHYSFRNTHVYSELGIPFVQVIHNVYVWFDAGTIDRFNASAAHTSLFVAVSETVREYALNRFDISEDKCITIPNGIDIARFTGLSEYVRPELRSRLGIAPSEYAFLCVASFLPTKRILTAVQSFHLASPVCPEARLFIAGYPFHSEIYEQVDAYINRHNLGGKVRYLGHIPSMEQHYSAADVFLSASAFEGGQLVLLEALAANLAVVGTDVGFARHFRGRPGIEIVDNFFDNSPECFNPGVNSVLAADLAGAIAKTYISRQRPDLPADCIAAMDRNRTYQAYLELFCRLTGEACKTDGQKGWLELLPEIPARAVETCAVPDSVTALIGERQKEIAVMEASPYVEARLKKGQMRTWQRVVPGKEKRGPRVLVTVLAPPLPPDSGGTRYVANQLMPLADAYDLHLLIIGEQRMLSQLEKHTGLYDKYFHSITLVERESAGAGIRRKLRYCGKRLVLGLPFLDISYYSDAAVTAARGIIDRFSIDMLELHTAHTAYFKRFFPELPTVMAGHNVESGLFPYWVPAGLPLHKRLFESVVAKCSRRNAERVEIENAWGMEIMTFISKNDMNMVKGDAVKFHLPLTFPDNSPPVVCSTDDLCRVIWLGGFWWGPNREGMEWFADDILPRIRERLRERNIEFHVVGAEPTDKIRRMHDGENIHVRGFVEDLDPLLASAGLLMVPLLSGGGVRVKIVEAMNRGLPVLSTSKGCEGLEVEHGKSVFIADTAEAFAEALLRLGSDAALRNTLAQGASAYIREKHNHNQAVALKKRIYEQLMQGNTRRGGRSEAIY